MKKIILITMFAVLSKITFSQSTLQSYEKSATLIFYPSVESDKEFVNTCHNVLFKLPTGQTFPGSKKGFLIDQLGNVKYLIMPQYKDMAIKKGILSFTIEQKTVAGNTIITADFNFLNKEFFDAFTKEKFLVYFNEVMNGTKKNFRPAPLE